MCNRHPVVLVSYLSRSYLAALPTWLRTMATQPQGSVERAQVLAFAWVCPVGQTILSWLGGLE